MRAVAYVNKFLRARGGGVVTTLKTTRYLDSSQFSSPANFWAGLRH